MLGDDNDDV